MTTITVVIPYAPSITPQEMLNEAVDSVNYQDVETEIIIVEDADENGPAWARNKGLKRSNTQYVAFLDADDIWKEQKLSRQLERMRETGAGLCVEGDAHSTDSFVYGLLTGEIVSKTPSIMIDTNQVSTQFNECLERYEDHTFMIEAAVESGVCFCEDLVKVRKHEEGLSSQGDIRLIHQQRKKMASILEKNRNIDNYMVKQLRRVIYYKSSVQFRKKDKFLESIMMNLKSLQYGPTQRNIRSLIFLPVFVLISALKPYTYDKIYDE